MPEHEIEEFDWEKFKNTANAETFVKKAYYAAVKRLIKENHDKKNGTEEYHLDSMENILVRCLHITRGEIVEWVETREWATCKFPDMDKAIKVLKEMLPEYATSENVFPDREMAARVAQYIAKLLMKVQTLSQITCLSS